MGFKECGKKTTAEGLTGHPSKNQPVFQKRGSNASNEGKDIGDDRQGPVVRDQRNRLREVT